MGPENEKLEQRENANRRCDHGDELGDDVGQAKPEGQAGQDSNLHHIAGAIGDDIFDECGVVRRLVTE